VRGDNVMMGWERPKGRPRCGQRRMQRRQRLHGIGRILYVVDRVKDMIISGGEKRLFGRRSRKPRQHPAVAQCAVSDSDERWGTTVHAVVVTKRRREGVGERVICCRIQQTLIAGYKLS